MKIWWLITRQFLIKSLCSLLSGVNDLNFWLGQIWVESLLQFASLSEIGNVLIIASSTTISFIHLRLGLGIIFLPLSEQRPRDCFYWSPQRPEPESINIQWDSTTDWDFGKCKISCPPHKRLGSFICKATVYFY